MSESSGKTTSCRRTSEKVLGPASLWALRLLRATRRESARSPSHNGSFLQLLGLAVFGDQASRCGMGCRGSNAHVAVFPLGLGAHLCGVPCKLGPLSSARSKFLITWIRRLGSPSVALCFIYF